MSDIGVLHSISEEIVAALTIPELVTGMPVVRAMSGEDRINKQSLRSPAVGVCYLGSTNVISYAIGSRRMRVTTKWRLFVSTTNLKGTQSAREDAYNLLEGIRDRLHYVHSAISPRACYLFQEESCPDSFSEGKLVAYTDFFLDVVLGN